MDLYSYDSAGNLLYDNVHHYFYDAENRLIQVDGSLPYCTNNGTSGSAATACYNYDADGKRVWRTGYTNDNCDNTGKRGYVFDLAGHVIVETNGSGTACDLQVYAGDRHFGRQGGGSYFYHSDWLGTVRLINFDQNPTWGSQICTSLPFGDGLTCNSNASNVWHFTGKERDAESGLDHFDFRQYGSSLGRWMSPDPAGIFVADVTNPQTWNLFSYVMNNPLNFVDPFGLDCAYLNNAGNGVESVDRSSNSGECGQNGGTWFDGTINSNSVRTDPNSDWVSAEGVTAGGLGSNQQFSCGGSACGQDTLNSFVNSITGGPSSVTVSANDDALNPTASAVFGDVFKRMRWMDPDVCGGGYFVLKGAGGETGVAHGGAYGMVTHDSRSGTTVGYLAEAGVGPVSAGHESSLNVSTGKVESSNLLLAGLGDHAGVFAGYSNKNSPIQLGGYGEAFGRGGGAYVNVVPGGGCHK